IVRFEKIVNGKAHTCIAALTVNDQFDLFWFGIPNLIYDIGNHRSISVGPPVVLSLDNIQEIQLQCVVIHRILYSHFEHGICHSTKVTSIRSALVRLSTYRSKNLNRILLKKMKK